MLLQRIISAVVALVIVLLVLFVFPTWVVLPVVGVIVALAAWEWGGLIGEGNTIARITYIVGIALACLGYFATQYFQFWAPEIFAGILMMAGAWWVFAFAHLRRYPSKLPAWMVVVGGFLTLVPFFMALDSLARYPNMPRFGGNALLLFVLVTIWATDVGGYFAGRFLGRRKLLPNVSPNKTWEGVYGGLILAALIGFCGSLLLALPWYRVVPLCIITGAVSIVGDLLVSMFKREAGVKDSSNLFPGHGGILDRLDSLSAGAPLFVAGIAIGHGPW
ncbi:MAG: phosphatidate cytidylyltransferase [Pseudomonadota bacterium]